VVASRPNRPPHHDLGTAVVADRLGYDEVWLGETLRARLQTYADAGLDEIVLVPATAGDPGGERPLAALARYRWHIAPVATRQHTRHDCREMLIDAIPSAAWPCAPGMS
jgi:hypothetical protein